MTLFTDKNTVSVSYVSKAASRFTLYTNNKRPQNQEDDRIRRVAELALTSHEKTHIGESAL